MKMLIGGDWIEKQEASEVTNPFDNSVIDRVPDADSQDVEKAVLSALNGYEKMRSLPSYERAGILKKISESLEQRSEEIARILSSEVGKTIREARYEVSRTAETFAIGAEEAKRISGETIPFDAAKGAENRMGFYLRVPIGVIAAITPFNFPLSLAAHKIAPALASGNAVILKPSPATPLSDLMLGQVAVEAGLPDGALNIITGGASVGQQIVSDPRVRMVSFTGGLRTAEEIMKHVGMKRVALELGSNSAVILMSDADLDKVVPRIVTGGYTVAGQVCISVQRVFVHERILNEFLGKFLPAVEELKLGNQLDEDVNVGPMISEEAAARVEEWIKEAVDNGARILSGGTRDRTLFGPTVITDVQSDMKVCSEELFGPVVVVIPFADLSEAIQKVNKSKYGLQVGIYTDKLAFAFDAAKQLEVGGVMINDIPTFRVDLMPYGGVKGSGLGREGLKYAIEEMTDMKLICFNL